MVLSHGQKPLKGPLPPGVQQSPPVSKVLDDGTLEFQDGSHARPDVFLFCTGYNFTFPFLDKQVGLKVKEHLVSPLYKFLIPPVFPSLFIVGVCRAICPFPHFHIQVRHLHPWESSFKSFCTCICIINSLVNVLCIQYFYFLFVFFPFPAVVCVSS